MVVCGFGAAGKAGKASALEPGGFLPVTPAAFATAVAVLLGAPPPPPPLLPPPPPRDDDDCVADPIQLGCEVVFPFPGSAGNAAVLDEDGITRSEYELLAPPPPLLPPPEAMLKTVWSIDEVLPLRVLFFSFNTLVECLACCAATTGLFPRLALVLAAAAAHPLDAAPGG